VTRGTAAGDDASVIRNVVIHLANEQPLLGDLYAVPTSADAGLLCTNVRMMDGKRPVFIDAITSTFFFPYHLVRFLEIPPGELATHQASGGAGAAFASDGATVPGDLVVDDEARLPVVVGGPDDGAGGPDLENLEIELDIDEDFLRRVRDI
jgi:hypothetical protein